MKYIEAIEEFKPDTKKGYMDGMPSIFLAGGITDCPDWQKEIVETLKDENIVLLNPRRKNFPIEDPNASFEQIEWEHNHLRKATAILFWFPQDTLCPIVLYELGTWTMTDKPLFIGIEKGYERTQDVVIQTCLVKGKDTIFSSSLDELVKRIKDFVK